MRDLIYRDKAISVINRCKHRLQNGSTYEIIIDMMKAIPSADVPTTMTGVIDAIHEAEYRGYMKAVEERPQGEWILECDGENECDDLYRCPFCGAKYGCAKYDKPNFCNECGADMREREGE